MSECPRKKRGQRAMHFRRSTDPAPNPPMEAAEFFGVCQLVGLTADADIAMVLDVTPRTVRRWREEGYAIPGPVRACAYAWAALKRLPI